MKKLPIIAIFISISMDVFAINYHGRLINIENGLSQSSVTSIVYDRNGSLWIGTRFGLNEYRNGKVRSFSNPDNFGIQGSYINGLLCTEDGMLLVMTDKGLHKYINAEDRFVKISDESLNYAAEFDGLIFLGGNRGVKTYNPESGELTGEDSREWTDILAIYRYGERIIFVDRRNGISYSDGESTDFYDIPQIDGQTIMASCLYGSQLVLFVLGRGIVIFNLESGMVADFIRQGESGLGRDLILTASVINDRIWFGTDGSGIMIFNPELHTLSRLSDAISINPGIELPASVTTIFQDPIGNIWIGGVLSGVVGLKPASIKQILPGSIINSIFQDGRGDIYIGTDGGGIAKYSIGHGHGHYLPATGGLKITTIAEYDRNHLLTCAYNQGFYLVNKQTGSISPFVIIDRKTNEKECLSGNSPEALTLDDGKLLIFAVNLYLHDPRTGSFKLIRDNSSGDGTDLHIVRPYGNRVCAFNKRGIYNIDVEGLHADRIFSSSQQQGSINAMSVGDSTIIYGTDYGLYVLDVSSGESKRISTGLFNRVTGLSSGPDGSLWIGADNLLFINKDGAFELIGDSYGVAANEISESALASNGTLFLGGSEGCLEIENPGDILSGGPAEEREIVLHDITVDGRKVFLQKGRIRIPHDFGSMGITVTLCDSDPLERTVYKYDIDGPARFSIETYNDNIQIPALMSGQYSIKVSYFMGKGVWSGEKAVADVRVLKPWYKSTVMNSMYLLLMISVIFFSMMYMRMRIKKQLQEKLKSMDAVFKSKFERYIAEHLSENDLSVESIAVGLAMSRASLYSKVKHNYSLGVGEYIERQRMKKAEELLAGTSLSIAEIAENVGYSTQRYFSTRFKTVVGKSPLAFRKNK